MEVILTLGTGYAVAETITDNRNHVMKTFLRHMATRQYFQSLEKWTLDREDAHDFGLISKAMKAAHKLRMSDLELELSLEDPDQATITPFEKLLRGLARARKHEATNRRASRHAALA